MMLGVVGVPILYRTPLDFRNCRRIGVSASREEARVSPNGFPSFLPREVEKIRDQSARRLAKRIERIPVLIDSSEMCIMSSCVKPVLQNEIDPVVLLHGFDSNCLEWRYTYPLLEDAGLETWAVDILGWGFSDLEALPSCSVDGKREHLYKLWKSYVKRPMILVGPSLGAAVAIDFAICYPDAVSKLILIDASVYVEDTGRMTMLPKPIVYAGISLLKSIPLRMYVNFLANKKLTLTSNIDMTNMSRLHCLQPWWEEATLNFMKSGGYNVVTQIPKVKKKTLIIWGEDDQIINKGFAQRLLAEIPNSVLHIVPDCGHIPHVEKPGYVANLILEFTQKEEATATYERVVSES